MIRVLRRILVAVLALVLILAVGLSALAVLTVRRSFPQVDGEVRLPGLQAEVEVLRDAYGVPHVYAANAHDLFFAQGYVHAQDRFYQMDFWRHTGSGRLSEMLGDSALDTDRFLRTMGWGRVTQQELEQIDAETLAILEAYAEGVNAYLAEHAGAALSLEYAILPVIAPGYRPEPWEPLHSLTWAKAMAWDLGDNMDSEIMRAALLKELSPEQVNALFPPYPDSSPYILPDSARGVGAVPDSAAIHVPAAARPALERLPERLAAVESLLGPTGPGIGSNNWVIAGARTASGQPLLGNDPHLGVQMPSIWYEIGLHCTPKGEACPFEVTGFSFPGDPGVIIGHNDRIAWGVTNLGPDVQDLYIEKINPENPNQYEYNGEWVDMALVQETIQVAGGEAVSLTVRSTRHGPIISDTYGDLEDFAARSGVETPEQYAIALRWTALEPAYLFRAILKFDTAQNWEEFREAARDFVVPAQNLVYADVDGNIGYQTPGNLPIRAQGDGTLPVPGWTDEYEWEGYIPFEELPSAFNPPEGYVATANNAVVGPEYPYQVTSLSDLGYRARRIVDMIENAPGPITPEYMAQMHGDALDLNAARLVPVLLQAELEEPRLTEQRLEQVRGLLQNWDYQVTAGSAPAALFEVFWRNLLIQTFYDDLPEDYWPTGGDRWYEVVGRLAEQPDSAWWDQTQTPDEKETRDMIFSYSLAQAWDEMVRLQGNDPQRWAWGKLHTVTFRNATLGESGIAAIEALFNRGPFATGGGSDLVNATSWNAREDYTVAALPSMRMIVDFADLGNSRTMHTTGQSGHAYHPHYIDMAEPWSQIEYHPMLWGREQVEGAAVSRLRLLPK